MGDLQLSLSATQLQTQFDAGQRREIATAATAGHSAASSPKTLRAAATSPRTLRATERGLWLAALVVCLQFYAAPGVRRAPATASTTK